MQKLEATLRGPALSEKVFGLCRLNETLPGQRPCRGGNLAEGKSLPGEDLAGAEKLAGKKLAGVETVKANPTRI